MDKSIRMDDTDKFVPPWKSNDVKVMAVTIYIVHNYKYSNKYMMISYFSFSHGYGCNKQCTRSWTTTATSRRNGYVPDLQNVYRIGRTVLALICFYHISCRCHGKLFHHLRMFRSRNGLKRLSKKAKKKRDCKKRKCMQLYQ